MNRFIEMHKKYFDIALKEIENGNKEECWMWYIFPQIQGLGFSFKSRKYAMNNLDEAKQYLDNRYLCNNMYTICNALIQSEVSDIYEMMDDCDCLKLKSSMTLFDMVKPNDVFKMVLDKYFNGEKCLRTIDLLKDIDNPIDLVVSYDSIYGEHKFGDGLRVVELSYNDALDFFNKHVKSDFTFEQWYEMYDKLDTSFLVEYAVINKINHKIKDFV